MIDELITAGTVAAALGCALIAGLMFAFSTSVMPALGRRPETKARRGHAGDQHNDPQSAVRAGVGGTTVLCLALAVTAPLTTDQANAMLRGIGSVLYVIGTFGVTMVVNVPMNNELDALDAADDKGNTYWGTYLPRWTAWNHHELAVPWSPTGRRPMPIE
jgi:uncharacterized membrane protein